MTKLDKVKKQIKALPENDKNGVLLGIVQILHGPDMKDYEPWNANTLNRVSDFLEANGIKP